MIWVKCEPEYFCERGWTGTSDLPGVQRVERSETHHVTLFKMAMTAGPLKNAPGYRAARRWVSQGLNPSYGLIDRRAASFGMSWRPIVMVCAINSAISDLLSRCRGHWYLRDESRFAKA